MARYASGPNQPLTHWNNIPIYLTTILTAVFAVSIVVLIIAGSAGLPLAGWLAFHMPLAPAWTLWRLVTYVLVAEISFFTPFAIICFYWWSVGIETHLGRGILSKLLILLALSGPVTGALWWWVLSVPSLSIGSYAFTCGLMIAFATLYPNAEAWGWVPFKWLAFACLFCGSLMLLASKSWVELSQLWTASAVGFAYIRHAKELEFDDYESPISRVRTWFHRRKFKVVRDPIPSSSYQAPVAGDDSSSDETDRLLDKIAKSGMGSLTTKERARLEQAREDLIRKDHR